MMRSKVLSLTAVLAALAAGGLGAMEKASAEMSRSRLTSSIEQVSNKPLLLFSMRGRLDPFMAYPLLTVLPQSRAFDISDLVFTGIVEVDGKGVALFQGTGGRTFTLKGSTLTSPENKPVEGIRGVIQTADENTNVVLSQGERKLSYTAKRPSKRLTAPHQR